MVAHDAPTGDVGFVISGKGVDFPMSHGIAGGYPGAPGRYVLCRGARAGNGAAAPLSFAEIGGEHDVVSFGVYHVGLEDIFYVRWNGGGGVRDPLARDPESVARDVADGAVSVEAARDLYGVVLGPDGGLDQTGTASLRADMRQSRSRANTAAAIPARMHLPNCACDCPGADDARATVIRERLLSTVAPAYTTGPRATLTEIICKTCGALLDTQVTMLGAGPLCEEQRQ
jgi:hypothetical protein